MGRDISGLRHRFRGDGTLRGLFSSRRFAAGDGGRCPLAAGVLKIGTLLLLVTLCAVVRRSGRPVDRAASAGSALYRRKDSLFFKRRHLKSAQLSCSFTKRTAARRSSSRGSCRSGAPSARLWPVVQPECATRDISFTILRAVAAGLEPWCWAAISSAPSYPTLTSASTMSSPPS